MYAVDTGCQTCSLPITDPLVLACLLFEAGQQVSAVAMPAGRADRIARRDEARPGRIAGVDRLLEPDIVAVVRSDVAHGRKACTEHVVRILDRGHAPEAVGEFQPAITADVDRKSTRLNSSH